MTKSVSFDKIFSYRLTKRSQGCQAMSVFMSSQLKCRFGERCQCSSVIATSPQTKHRFKYPLVPCSSKKGNNRFDINQIALIAAVKESNSHEIH
jgi:hypothetical protein